MHIAVRKSLSNGTLSMTTAGTWDKLKYQLSKLDHFDTRDWDGHGFAWESFRDGNIINDASALWRYIDIERDDTNDLEVFEGRVVFLIEIDPVFG